jgi:hypothetical protein
MTDRDLHKVLRVQQTSSIEKSNAITSKVHWFITKSLLHQSMNISLREYCERIVVGVGRLVGDVCSLDDSIESVHIVSSVSHTSETSVSLLKTILPGNNSIFQPLLLLLNIASLECEFVSQNEAILSSKHSLSKSSTKSAPETVGK